MPTKKTATLTYTIDTGSTDIYANKDRFKKKPVDPKVLSKREKKLAKRILGTSIL